MRLLKDARSSEGFVFRVTVAQFPAFLGDVRVRLKT